MEQRSAARESPCHNSGVPNDSVVLGLPETLNMTSTLVTVRVAATVLDRSQPLAPEHLQRTFRRPPGVLPS